MGQRVRIFAARKWQLSLALGTELPELFRKTSTTVPPPAPGLRVIWPEQADPPEPVNPDTSMRG
jgi:hypothetical protein